MKLVMIMPRNFIDPAFISLARETIMSILPEDSFNTITRKDLCIKLDLHQKDAVVFSRMLDFGLLPEFESRGPNGIGRKGQRRPAPSLSIDDEFIERLVEVLAKEVPRKGSITRKDVAIVLGDPGQEMETKISRAFSSGKISSYELVPGSGIRKKK